MNRLWRALTRIAMSGFPWSHHGADPWRRQARRALINRWPGALRPAACVAMILVWPLASLRQALAASQNIPDPADRLWLKVWFAALTEHIPPAEFVSYQLHRSARRSPEWRYEWETVALLSEVTDPAAARLLSDKRASARWLAEQGIPAVPVLAHATGGEIISKPRYGARGAGVRQWRLTGSCYCPVDSPSGRPLGAEELDSYAEEHGLLLQPMIKAHPSVGHPCVARLVTYRPVEHAAHLAMALVQSVPKGTVLSHMGPLRLVETETGHVLPPGPGQTLAGGRNPISCPVEGKILPGWGEIARQVVRAHSLLEGCVPLVGWDVIFGPQGPMVLEGNTAISLRAFQSVGLAPAGIPQARDLV
ncbi:MAG: hypothetical protein AAF501_09785 [Pseudomonadota bacterium]